MYKPVVLIASPDLKTVETPERVSFCIGLRPDAWDEGDEWLLDDSAIERKCAAFGEALVVQVIRENGMPVQVRIWRSLLSGYELFFATLDDGKILLTDHLRNIIAEMPMERRNIRGDALTDFMLFRAAPGKLTYCEGIQKVWRGERVTIDLQTGEAGRAHFDKLRNIAEKASLEAYLDGIDQAFEKVIGSLRNVDGLVTLFSGGVDSTVLQSYLGEKVPALMGLTWSMVEYEKEYGEQAARLLNVPFHTFRVEADEYLPLLESSIDCAGVPLRFDQMVMTYKAFQQPWKVFVTGGGADGIFGMDHVRGGVAWAARILARAPGSNVIADALMQSGHARLARLGEAAKGLLTPVMDPEGFGVSDGLAAMAANIGLAERYFGKELIARRLLARIEDLPPVVEFSAPPTDRIGRHLEFGHWSTQIVEDHMEQHRHLAHGAGKSYIGPYLSRPIVDSCLRVPVSERYVRGSQSKYLLKELLKRRVPDYPVDQKKGLGLIDSERFYVDGPMKDIWERYELPDFLTGPDREHFLERPTVMTFAAVSFAMWRDRILRNKDLTVTPGVHRYGG